MHFLIGVILPFHYEGKKLDEAIGEILKPWDERSEDENITVEMTEDGETWRHNPNGQWDWWQLGGRWSTVWGSSNVISIADFIVNDCQIPYAVAMAPDIWLSRETWDGSTLVKHEDHDEKVMKLLTENRDMFIAAVDIHS